MPLVLNQIVELIAEMLVLVLIAEMLFLVPCVVSQVVGLLVSKEVVERQVLWRQVALNLHACYALMRKLSMHKAICTLLDAFLQSRCITPIPAEP